MTGQERWLPGPGWPDSSSIRSSIARTGRLQTPKARLACQDCLLNGVAPKSVATKKIRGRNDGRDFVLIVSRIQTTREFPFSLCANPVNVTEYARICVAILVVNVPVEEVVVIDCEFELNSHGQW